MLDSNNSDGASEKTMLDIYLKEKASEASMRRSVFQAAKELDLAYASLKKSQASHNSSVSKHAKLQTELKTQGVKVRVLHDAWKKATENNQDDDNGAGGGGGDLVGSNAKTGETTINNAKTRILDQFEDDNIDDDQLLHALAETEKLMITKQKAEKEKLISTKQSSTGGKDAYTKPPNDEKETATQCPKVPTLTSTASTKGPEVLPMLNREFQESSVNPSALLPNVVTPSRGSSSTRGRKNKTAPESPSVEIAEPPTIVLPPKSKKTKVVH